MLSIRAQGPETQRLALVVGIAAFVVVTFWASYASMWELWQTSDHRHGLLVIPISAFLIWRLRYQLVDLPVAPDARGLLLVVPLAIAWLVARLAGIQFIEHVAVLAMIPAAVGTLAGPHIVLKLLFPFGFLVLATPLGESLVPYLMVITADISTGLLKLSGIPLLRNGQYISLTGGEFVVADVCAGLRYLVSGVMISLLYGYLTYSSVRKRLILVAVAAITLVVANGVRAYIVMAVASATRMQYFGGRDHIYFGWLMFGVVMMLIMWVGARYADDEVTDSSERSDTAAMRTPGSVFPLIAALGLVMLAVTLAPLQADFGQTGAMLAAAAALVALVFFLSRRRSRGSRPDSGRDRPGAFRLGWGRFLTGTATLAVLIMTPRFAVSIENRAIEFVDDFDIDSVVPCSSAGPWNNDWHPQFSNADIKRSATFTCDGVPVGVFVAAYASALQGRELISSTHRIVPKKWDRNSQRSSSTVRTRDGRERSIAEIRFNDRASNVVVWYWYEVDQDIAAGPLMAKMYQVLALMRGRPAGGRVVVIETPADSGTKSTQERLQTVAAAIIGTASRAHSAEPY